MRIISEYRFSNLKHNFIGIIWKKKKETIAINILIRWKSICFRDHSAKALSRTLLEDSSHTVLFKKKIEYLSFFFNITSWDVPRFQVLVRRIYVLQRRGYFVDEWTSNKKKKNWTRRTRGLPHICLFYLW